MSTHKRIFEFLPVFAFTVSMGVASYAFAETAGQYIDDATVTTKTKAAIMQDKNLKGSNISVETNKSTVQLTGSVASQSQEAEAVRVASEIEGVKNVKNNLQVSSAQ